MNHAHLPCINKLWALAAANVSYFSEVSK